MNVLAIGAHFDDVELGCGGTLAKHVANHDRVTVYVATKSGFANPMKKIVRSNDAALREGQNAMDILGAKLRRGPFITNDVEFTDELASDIIKVVDSSRADIVYTHWVGDIHHDHQAVARASLHSCRHVPRMLMYRSNWYHSVSDFRGNFYIDITGYWKTKEKVIKAHKSEMKRTGKAWIQFFKNEAENAGQKIGVEYAEVFEVVKWLW